MSVVDKFLRQVFKGVSWQNKYIYLIILALDLPDWVVCQMRGLSHLPKYSIRVRSDGVTGQFGGNNFDYFGNFTAQLLIDSALLTSKSKVLEIGCGSGRTALALTKTLEKGNYMGVDIDKVSINACQRHQLFQQSGFVFEHIDVQNMMYNSQGKTSPKSYKFSFEDASFDHIFLISVFTHMLPEEVSNYIGEISRLLRPGGKCMLSTFLMDYGTEGKILNFPYQHDVYHLHQESLPEKAVGYYQSFFEEKFTSVNMSLLTKRIGNWRSFPVEGNFIEFGQDVLVFSK